MIYKRKLTFTDENHADDNYNKRKEERKKGQDNYL